MPVEGRFWMHPETGRVERSELVAEDRQLHATIAVRDAANEALGLWMPAEVHETYFALRAVVMMEGCATTGTRAGSKRRSPRRSGRRAEAPAPPGSAAPHRRTS